MMIKHTAICDRCGYEEDFRKDLDIPQRWELFGICPKYLLCPQCSCTLKSKESDLIYLFVTNPTKSILIKAAER